MKPTAAQLTWLRHLAAHGETGWNRMPRRGGSFDSRLASLTNRTWRPMIAAGWIEAKYYQPNFRMTQEHYFTITEAGRKILVDNV